MVVVVEVEEELVDVAYASIVVDPYVSIVVEVVVDPYTSIVEVVVDPYASIVDDVLTLVEVVVETAVHIYIADTTSESIIPSLVALA
ncbi:MAG: hypothetical protein BWX91_02592 [Spirochaetes bacterium ADurb.Bin133]|nr:MAG: hypothetical protein BWX91_02592 [Spirochaetes bacterium ADurb.Bin133]